MERKAHQGSVIKVQPKRVEHEDLDTLVLPEKINFIKDGIAGKGTFGIVQKVRVLSKNNNHEEAGSSNYEEHLAMKTVQLKRKESRELMILKKINHRNIVKLRYYYFSYTRDFSDKKLFLNLLFNIQPTTFFDEISRRELENERWTENDVLYFCRQVADGLNYLHEQHIAHRDIKPRNLLLNPSTGLVQVCDLGSACHVNSGQPLTAYICSRFYRAPELLLGSRNYGTSVDIWSLGCVVAEMALLSPLLEGEDTGDQVAVMMDMFGQPTDEDLEAMGVEDGTFTSALKILTYEVDGIDKLQNLLASNYPEIARVVGKMMVYNPIKRYSCTNIIEDLRQTTTSMSGTY